MNSAVCLNEDIGNSDPSGAQNVAVTVNSNNTQSFDAFPQVVPCGVPVYLRDFYSGSETTLDQLTIPLSFNMHVASGKSVSNMTSGHYQASLSSLKTTISGTLDPAMGSKYIMVSNTPGFPTYRAALSVSRENNPAALFTINSTNDSERLVWSSTEIANKEVPLELALVKSTYTSGTNDDHGNVKFDVTFGFEYE